MLLYKEVKYLLHFSLIEKYLEKNDYHKAIKMSEEIGAMPWKTIENIK